MYGIKKGNKMGAKVKYFMFGFRNAFNSISLQTNKELGQISSEIYEKRKVLVGYTQTRKKITKNKR